MTTTQALAKLVKKVVGVEGKNSITKNIAALADGWDGSNVGKIPELPTLESNGTKYYVLKVVKSNSGITYTWDEKTFT